MIGKKHWSIMCNCLYCGKFDQEWDWNCKDWTVYIKSWNNLLVDIFTTFLMLPSSNLYQPINMTWTSVSLSNRNHEKLQDSKIISKHRKKKNQHYLLSDHSESSRNWRCTHTLFSSQAETGDVHIHCFRVKQKLEMYTYIVFMVVGKLMQSWK